MPKTPPKIFLGGLQQKKCPKNMFFSYFKKIPTKKVLLECYLSVIFNIFFHKNAKNARFCQQKYQKWPKVTYIFFFFFEFFLYSVTSLYFTAGVTG